MRRAKLPKRILSLVCAGLIVIAQLAFVIPCFEENQAYAADGSIEVRVQYEGWREDKIPTIATFSRSELNALGSSTYTYANVTDVATVMRTIGKGPELTAILDASGIDRSSISYIVFRTTDGSGKNKRFSLKITPSMYENNRYYYPNLYNNYERDNDGGIICPGEGALSGASFVPAIIATSHYSSKNPKTEINESKLIAESYCRFCLGQTKLTEGKWTIAGYSGDTTSEESITNIFGIDVVLKGSPIKGLSLSLDNSSLKIGSAAKIKVQASGDSAFADDIRNSDLKWTSSDNNVATVDKNGTVTIVGKGQATITATTLDGTSATLVIDTESASDDKDGKAEKKTSSKNAKKTTIDEADKKVVVVGAKELDLGDKIEVSDTENGVAQEQLQALGEAENYGRGALYVTVGTGVAAAGLGFGLRIRKYKIDK